MLRLFLIIGGVVAAVWFGLKAFDRIIDPSSRKAKQEQESDKIDPTKAGPVALPPPLVADPQKPSAVQHADKSLVPYVEAISVYQFKNRPVPIAPFGRAENAIVGVDKRGMQLAVDTGSNTWIMRGPPNEVEQMQRIAGMVDVVQTEVDLDFVLIALSEQWLRSFGLQAAYQRGAAWLPSFSLDATGGTLRLESNSFAVDVSAQASDTSARLVSSPVIRCITGEPWTFSADKQVPIASVQRSEGVVTTGYEYREIGLGFEGTVQKAGPRDAFRLTISQRNGDTEGTGNEQQTMPPTLRQQLLKTSLVIEVGRWSCIGGVTSWQTETIRRLLGKSQKETQELLLVFVRPRDSLELAPKAFPVDYAPQHLSGFDSAPWDMAPGRGLLPPPDWQKEEGLFLKGFLPRKGK